MSAQDLGPNGGFSFDFSSFNEKFLKYALEVASEAAEKGAWEALNELKHDADSVYPKTPHLEGNLRGDYTLELAGIRTSKVKEIGSEKKSGSRPPERIGAKTIIARLIFRMPYAAKWHEALDKAWDEGGVNWSEPGVGPKYVERKLAMFAKKYMGIIADHVRRAAGG